MFFQGFVLREVPPAGITADIFYVIHVSILGKKDFPVNRQREKLSLKSRLEGVW